MNIRKLSIKDLPKIDKFKTDNPPEIGVFTYPDKKEMHFAFNSPNCKMYGYFINDDLVGWGGYLTGFKDYSAKKGYFEMSALYIAKTSRNEGLGEFLLDSIMVELKQREKYKKIFLTVSPLNIKALMLYLKKGFIIFDFKKNYYGEGEDRIFMSLI